MPFDPIDFEARDFMPHSGWPIQRDGIEPFYPQANRLCEAGEFAYTVEQAFDRPLRPMIAGFESPNFSTNTLEKFSCPTDFRCALRTPPAGRGRTCACCCTPTSRNLNLDASGSVLHSRHGADARTQATHGAGTAIRIGHRRTRGRAAAAREPRRANRAASAITMTWSAATTCAILPARWARCPSRDRSVPCGTATTSRTRASTAGAASHCAPSAQRQHRIGNFIARLHHPRITEPRSPQRRYCRCCSSPSSSSRMSTASGCTAMRAPRRRRGSSTSATSSRGRSMLPASAGTC